MQFIIKNVVYQRLSDILFLPNGLVRKKGYEFREL